MLLDFGAARRVISDMTQALTVILKPGYAPIEQYAEMPGVKQGPWTDIYALGAVVYFTITGRTPPPAVGRMMQDVYEPLAVVAAVAATAAGGGPSAVPSLVGGAVAANAIGLLIPCHRVIRESGVIGGYRW